MSEPALALAEALRRGRRNAPDPDIGPAVAATLTIGWLVQPFETPWQQQVEGWSRWHATLAWTSWTLSGPELRARLDASGMAQSARPISGSFRKFENACKTRPGSARSIRARGDGMSSSHWRSRR
jgi:hypothetical protein